MSMAPPQRKISRTNIIHPVQYTIEGDNEADISTYAAKIAAAAIWEAPVIESKLSCDPAVSFRQNAPSGQLSKQGRVKTSEAPTGVISGLLADHPSSLALLEWGMNASSDTAGPSQSRTWLRSYRDSNGVTIYQILRGCKPTSCRVNITGEEVTIEVNVTAKDYLEGPAATTINDTNHFAAGAASNLRTNELAEQILRYADAGEFVFDPNAVDADGIRTIEGDVLPWTDLDISTTWGMRPQKSSGSFVPIYDDYGTQMMSGSTTWYKRGEKLNEIARKQNKYPAYVELEVPTSTKKDTWASTDLYTQSSNKLVIYSKLPGVWGNTVSVQVVAGSTGSTLRTEVRGRAITVTLANAGSTWQEIANSINTHEYASSLVLATYPAAQASQSATSAVARTSLTGGADKIRKIIFERFAFSPSQEEPQSDEAATMENKSWEADRGEAVIPA